MLVPFPIFDSTFRNKATLECNDFLVRLPDTHRSLYEFANRESVRVTRCFFERPQIDWSKVLFPRIGMLLKMLIIRLYSENSLNPISNPPESATSPTFATSMVPEKSPEDGFQLSLCLDLFFIQIKTGGLELFD